MQNSGDPRRPNKVIRLDLILSFLIRPACSDCFLEFLVVLLYLCQFGCLWAVTLTPKLFLFRYKPVDPQSSANLVADDPMPEYMNVLGMIFSMCGLMMRVRIFSFMYSAYYAHLASVLDLDSTVRRIFMGK